MKKLLKVSSGLLVRNKARRIDDRSVLTEELLGGVCPSRTSDGEGVVASNGA